jgi:hypothetical protein
MKKILLLIVFLSPYLISASPEKKDERTIGLGIGHGSYISGGGCSRARRMYFTDMAFHARVKNPPVGGEATLSFLDRTEEFYEDPPQSRGFIFHGMASLEGRVGEIGMGGLLVNREELIETDRAVFPTFRLRLNFHPEGRTYLSAHLFDSFPFYSGGSMFRMGTGFRPVGNTDLWLGMDFGPFDAGILGSVSQPIGNSFRIGLTGRYGESDPDRMAEHAFSVKLTYTLPASNEE